MTKAIPLQRALDGLGSLLTNAAIAAAVVFLGWCVFRILSVSNVHYSPTSAQHTYAWRYCVSEMKGDLGSAYVSKPDLFGSTGSTPRLVIRCTFGPKEYLMKTVELMRSTETPRQDT